MYVVEFAFVVDVGKAAFGLLDLFGQALIVVMLWYCRVIRMFCSFQVA